LTYNFTPYTMHQRQRTVLLKQLLLLLLITAAGTVVRAQKVDSIFFHLYTDSLKKGTHNYINVDGKLSNGRWLPLTNKEIDFTTSVGKFEGNSLVIDTAFKGEKVTVKAVLKNNTAIWKEIIIYIKKVEIIERLKTVDEIMNTPSTRRSRRGLLSS
jgi:hypothetical protein